MGIPVRLAFVGGSSGVGLRRRNFRDVCKLGADDGKKFGIRHGFLITDSGERGNFLLTRDGHFFDLLHEFHHSILKRFGAGGTAGNVDIHGNDFIHAFAD